MNSTWCRALAPAAVLAAAFSPAFGQQQPSAPVQQQAAPQQTPQPQATQQPAPQATQQPAPQQSPYCSRLEAQLQAFDRSNPDALRADQVRKLEDSAKNQENEIARQEAAAKRIGCEQNSFFVLFSRQPQQCGPLNNKIQQLQANLEQTRSDIERLQGEPPPEREGQRRGILTALVQNNCGQQYQAALGTPEQQPRSGGGGSVFESLFGSKPPAPFSAGPNTPAGFSAAGSYRTICVRTCDGFYYPISQSSTPAKFADDEKSCRQSCPATEATLFAYPNPDGNVNQAMSLSGQSYTSLPNAFRYRQVVDSSCSCRRPGESWQQTLKGVEDSTVEKGDIVVNDQNSKQLSQPRVDAQGKPIKPAPDPRAASIKPEPLPKPTPPAAPAPAQPAAEAAPAPADVPDKPDPNRKVRSVGPTFIPSH